MHLCKWVGIIMWEMGVATYNQGLKTRVLASPKASSYIIGLVGLYLTVWELAHICQVSLMNSFNSKLLNPPYLPSE